MLYEVITDPSDVFNEATITGFEKVAKYKLDSVGSITMLFVVGWFWKSVLHNREPLESTFLISDLDDKVSSTKYLNLKK